MYLCHSRKLCCCVRVRVTSVFAIAHREACGTVRYPSYIAYPSLCLRRITIANVGTPHWHVRDSLSLMYVHIDKKYVRLGVQLCNYLLGVLILFTRMILGIQLGQKFTLVWIQVHSFHLTLAK